MYTHTHTHTHKHILTPTSIEKLSLSAIKRKSCLDPRCEEDRQYRRRLDWVGGRMLVNGWILLGFIQPAGINQSCLDDSTMKKATIL